MHRRVQRSPSARRGPLLAVLALLMTTRCDTLHPEELDCEDAVAYLQRCCPSFPASSIQCVYGQGGCNLPLDGSGGGCISAYQEPDISESQSRCIRGESCSQLVADGTCAAVANGTLPQEDADCSPTTTVAGGSTCEDGSACGSFDASSVDLEAADGVSDASTVRVACEYSGIEHECVLNRVPTTQSTTADGECAQHGGSPVATCPTSGLLGCCTLGQTEVCWYDSPDAGASLFDACMLSGGSWMDGL